MKNLKQQALTVAASTAVAVLWVIFVILFGLFCKIVTNLFMMGWDFI